MRISYVNLGGLTTLPDGSVAYDFDGHVHARGVDLDASQSGTPSSDEEVRWLHADGSEAVSIAGIGSNPGDPPFGQLALSALGEFFAEIVASVNGDSRVLLDQDGKSDFVQVAHAFGSLLAMTLDAGDGFVHFSTSSFSDVTTVSHGLGVVPTAVLATASAGAGVALTATNFTTSTFDVIGDYPYGTLTQNVAFTWAAIG